MTSSSGQITTCTDCAMKNRCWERSRNYPCKDFKPKEGIDLGRGKESGKQSKAISEG